MDRVKCECTCRACIDCCKRKPGWFAPGEAEKAAAYMGLTLQEFFQKYLVVDSWGNNEGADTLVLSPASDENTPGQYDSRWGTTGRCVFLLADERCAIHPVKPLECALTHHDYIGKSSGTHEYVKDLWDDEAGKGQDQIKELLNGGNDTGRD